MIRRFGHMHETWLDGVMDRLIELGVPCPRSTIRELIAASADDLLRLRGFGESSLKQVEYALAKHGLKLRGE